MNAVNPLLLEMLPWVKQGDCCSQLLMRLALQTSGEENPGLVRALWGFCRGILYTGGPCGFLTGGGAVLSHAAGHGGADDPAHPMAVALIADYVDWFQERTAAYGGTSCPQVSLGVAGGAAGPDAEPDMMLCGGLLAECWEKIVELTAAYDIDITQPKQVR